MNDVESTITERLAQAAIAFERERTGHEPSSVSVLLSEDTLVITLHGTLSAAEMAAAGTPEGAARVQDFHRQLFATASEPLRQEIKRITGVEVREAAAEVDHTTGAIVAVFATGTTVQVFLLAQSVPRGAGAGNAASNRPTLVEPTRAAGPGGTDGATRLF